VARIVILIFRGQKSLYERVRLEHCRGRMIMAVSDVMFGG
jgi:hypothetical protein